MEMFRLVWKSTAFLLNTPTFKWRLEVRNWGFLLSQMNVFPHSTYRVLVNVINGLRQKLLTSLTTINFMLLRGLLFKSFTFDLGLFLQLNHRINENGKNLEHPIYLMVFKVDWFIPYGSMAYALTNLQFSHTTNPGKIYEVMVGFMQAMR